MIKRPKVGIGIYIRKDNKILFLLRKGPHATGMWSPPGGHLEFMETFEECARRETLEETNLKIKNIEVLGVTNDFYKEEDNHYTTIHLVADYDSGELKNMEPHKCQEMNWFEWNNLPTPLMTCNKNFLKLNINPFDKE